MEYIEKAKYELIMAIKNEENSTVIDFLQQYYNDMVNLANILYKNNNSNILNQSTRFLLKIYENESLPSCFIFSDEKLLLEFHDKYNKHDNRITVLELHNLDPENNYRPNFEESFEIWVQNKAKSNLKNKKI